MRYARQIKLRELGKNGQALISKAKVLVIGAGGLGCPVLQYLVGAGVGEICIVDQDKVSLSNLQRQILFTEKNIGQNKAIVAKENLQKLNSEIEIVAVQENINKENALELIQDVNCVIDGSDNFSTKYLVNDVCASLGIPLVQGSIHQWSGQLGVYHINGKGDLRDLFPMPPQEEPPTCEEEGILGPVAGIMGSAMALEAIKIIGNLNPEFHFSTYNGLENSWTNLKFEPLEREEVDFLNTDYDFYCRTNDPWMIMNEINRDIYFTVDVREEYEIEKKKEGVLYLPLGLLQTDFNESLLDGKIPLFTCENGSRSMAAANWYRKEFKEEAYYLKEDE